MWKLRSVKTKYTTLGGEELETFSEDEVLGTSFESKLEAIIYVANIKNISPWDDNFRIYYHEDYVEINIFGCRPFEGYGFWYYYIEKV